MAAPTRLIWVDDDQAYVNGILGRLAQTAPELEIDPYSSFADGSQALRSKEYDVALFDLDLGDPAGGGRELIECARSADPLIEIVVLSNFDRIEVIADCTRRGAGDFMVKSDNAAEIHFRVQRALERRKRRQREQDSIIPPVEGIFSSPTMKELYRRAIKISANRGVNVLIRGETGVGKEVFANLVNRSSGETSGDEASRPFVAVNCAAIPKTLMESTFFGHEKGAFTGATTSKAGKFELADGGDLYLDELATLDLEMQAKLLRVLESKTVERVGSHRTLTSDFRVISATNEGLEQMISAGTFRQDLFERLAGYELVIPPLRERPEDVPDLIQHFIEALSGGAADAEAIPRLSDECSAILRGYSWPGNVRQLRQVVQVMLALSDDGYLSPSLLPAKILNAVDGKPQDESSGGSQLPWDQTWKDFEALLFRRYIDRAVRKLGGNPSLRGLSDITKIPRSTLSDRLRQAGIKI